MISFFGTQLSYTHYKIVIITTRATITSKLFGNLGHVRRWKKGNNNYVSNKPCKTSGPKGERERE